MKLEEFKTLFLNECEKINIVPNENQIEEFFKYMNGVLEWNKKINVTAITDEKMFVVKHFIDSLTINQYLEEKDKIIDIGTGAGFPSIPLKIMNKEKEFTLIDSINKKLNVIREINKDINLDKLEIIHCRAEDLANKIEYREKYDVAVTRAVSNLSTITEYMLPFVKINGIAICMKGPNYESELDNAKNAIKILGGKIEKIEKVQVNNEMERNLVIIKKIKNTPKNFPRGQGKPLKEPL